MEGSRFSKVKSEEGLRRWIVKRIWTVDCCINRDSFRSTFCPTKNVLENL